MFKKLFHKSHLKKDHTMDKMNSDMQKLCEYYLQEIEDRIGNDDISYDTVHAYLRHIPNRYTAIGWSEEVYIAADKCLMKLYEYSLSKGYIDKKISYEDFISF